MRSLILAGGGIKVGFQAGVLEVWLDEAGLTFDHADGASGGCFNLAMYCQGMSGKKIADNWRDLDPFMPVDLNWEHYWKLTYAPSLFTYDNFREKVLPFWGIDWKAINRSKKLGTFNAFNFSKKELEVITQDRMNEDYLIASVSLPMWFPPVVISGQTYIDAVYITDGNVEEAIRRGADEIWAIWTVSARDEWRDGFIAQYFHIIETVADTNFFSIWRRIKENNDKIAAGKKGEFGRHIEQKLLQAEVPIHYLINFSKDRMAETVNLGVKTAREWCKQNGVPVKKKGEDYPLEIHTAETKLQFTEEMKGYFTEGVEDYEEGFAQGKNDNNFLMFHLTIKIDRVNRFVIQPEHEAEAEGWIEYEPLGGKLTVKEGVFNLFVHKDDPKRKKMLYRLFFKGDDGKEYTLSGFKDIHDDPQFDLWSDTTTLYTRIYRGKVEATDEAGAKIFGSGILHIYELDFIKQLTTFRADGPTPHDRISAMNRFGMFFLGKLWDVYARHFIEYGPI
ncbi:MAG: patatin-like phospholipase family protein [Deltaproteobacteria bacterium]|nr:patatin-like phospholipase family protein [Deltaproteobacteria bacterium]